jgi:hypothetical protein
MDNLNLDFDGNHKKINLDEVTDPTALNIKPDNTMMGIDLLTNNKNVAKTDPTLNVVNDITGGMSSNENTPTINKEEHNFFGDNDNKNINIDEPINSHPPPQEDPLLNTTKGSESGEFKSIHQMNAQEIKNEKIDLIYKFKKLENQGIRTTMNYNMNSQLEDMRNEYIKLKKQREVDNSIKFQRKVMMALITGVEYLNGRFDPFDIKLDGWSESINENITDYDEVFEELAEKYGGKSEMAPELKLLMMIGGSAFMFHLTNTMFKSSIPGMDDIMRQNPDLMKQFAQAAVGSIGKQVPPHEQNNMGSMHQQRPGPPPMRHDIPQPSSRSDMTGPGGIDELIHQMNLQPNNIPDLDNISLMSGETGRLSNQSGQGGITLNL